MKLQARNRNPRKVAVMFIGNKGSGKSDLLSRIGGNISAGVPFRRGSTWSISEQDIMLDGEPALFFVLKASNRSPPLEELILISKVHECVHQALAETRIEFTIIIDQIMDEQVYSLYRDNVAIDNFRRLFAEVKIKGCSFNDIQIDNVIMLRFDTGKIKRGEFGPEILPGIIKQEAIQVNAAKDISGTKEDIQNANKDDSFGSWFMSMARVALGVVVAAGEAILTEVPRDEINAGVATDADR
ncbi:hypothetical protein BGZ98_002971, partial [Dissophora globulifera]